MKRGGQSTGILGGAVVAALAIGAALSLVSWSPNRAVGQGVEWRTMSIEQALADAGAHGQRVLVKFDAAWCSYCKTLDAEVLATSEGAAVTADMIPLRFDFDDETNRPLVERYVVMGLPTVLVLTPDATQVGRIMGYEGKADWLGQLRAAKTAVDPVPALRADHVRDPRDAEAMLRLGEALLVRGAPEEGEALLERATWAATGDAAEVAAEALFLLGRYHHRVRRDPRSARHLWRELASRYPDSDWAEGAWWWYGKAQAEVGQPEVGLEALQRRAEAAPNDAAAVSQWVEYALEHDLESDRVALIAALDGVVGGVEGTERDELVALRARLVRAPSPP